MVSVKMIPAGGTADTTSRRECRVPYPLAGEGQGEGFNATFEPASCRGVTVRGDPSPPPSPASTPEGGREVAAAPFAFKRHRRECAEAGPKRAKPPAVTCSSCRSA